MWHKVRAIAAEEAAKANTGTAGTKSEGAPHGWKQEVSRLSQELATLCSEVERLAAEVAALKSGRTESAASPDRSRKT